FVLFDAMAAIRDDEEHEEVREFSAREGGLGESSQRDLFIANQFGVEHAGAAARQDFTEDVEYRIIPVEVVWTLEGHRQERLRRGFDLDTLFAFLFGLNRSRAAGQRAGRNDGEILVGQ